MAAIYIMEQDDMSSSDESFSGIQEVVPGRSNIGQDQQVETRIEAQHSPDVAPTSDEGQVEEGETAFVGEEDNDWVKIIDEARVCQRPQSEASNVDDEESSNKPTNVAEDFPWDQLVASQPNTAHNSGGAAGLDPYWQMDYPVNNWQNPSTEWELWAHNQELSRKYEEKVQALNHAHDDIEQKASEITELRTRIAWREKELKEAKEELAVETFVRKATDEDYAFLKDHYNHQEAQLKDLFGQLQKSEETLLKKSFEWNAAQRSLSSEIGELRKNNSRLQANCSEWNKSFNEKRLELIKKEREIKDLYLLLENDGKNDLLVENVASLERSLQARVVERPTTREILEGAREKLQKFADELKRNDRQKRDELKSANGVKMEPVILTRQDALVAVNTRGSDVETAAAALREVERHTNLMTVMEKELMEARKANEDLRKIVCHMNGQINDLKEDVKTQIEFNSLQEGPTYPYVTFNKARHEVVVMYVQQ